MENKPHDPYQYHVFHGPVWKNEDGPYYETKTFYYRPDGQEIMEKICKAEMEFYMKNSKKPSGVVVNKDMYEAMISYHTRDFGIVKPTQVFGLDIVIAPVVEPHVYCDPDFDYFLRRD